MYSQVQSECELMENVYINILYSTSLATSNSDVEHGESLWTIMSLRDAADDLPVIDKVITLVW